MKIKIFLVALCAFLLIAVAGRFSISSKAASTSINVQGLVLCSNHPVAGVWVQSDNGGSHFSSWRSINGDGHIATFLTTLTTTFPTGLSLHVGCGNGSTPGSWWSDNWTPTIGVKSDMTLKAICNDNTAQRGPNTRCQFIPSSEAAAINWAAAKLDRGQEYADLCLKFVFDAYKFGASVDIAARHWVDIPINGGTYPQDIYNHITHGQRGSSVPPPAGALVFFLYPPNHVYSHIEISIGGGMLISTSDTFHKNTVHYETIDQHDHSDAVSRYAGWWLPDM